MTTSATQYKYVDSHCHLAAAEFENDLEEVIHRAEMSGVGACVIVSENVTEFDRLLKICDEYPRLLYPCLGVHPVQDGGSVKMDQLHKAIEIIHKQHHRLVGIGEVGLDFTPWLCNGEADRQSQRDVFRHQIQVALQYDLPVNVHSRSSAKETVQLLKQEGAKKVLLHNFAGKLSVAKEAVSLGYFLSFPPHIICKPERERLLQWVPLENLCLETDSPALGPVKGERNIPSNIGLVCGHIAKLKNTDEETVKMYAYNNTCKLFNSLKT